MDPIAIQKIKKKGIKAFLGRAESLRDISDIDSDVLLSFEMVEHLHDPTKFFLEINKINFKYFIMTVPYVKKSRVGLKYIRNRVANKPVNSEGVHIFELSPYDWELLGAHAGLKAVSREIYYQYPKYFGPLTYFLKNLWRKIDFEGFVALCFIKDNTYKKIYQSWN